MNGAVLDRSVAAVDSPSSSAPRQRTGRSRGAVRRMLATAIVGALALSLPTLVQGFYVEGTSMAPTLHPGQLVMVNKGVWHLDRLLGPGRGDFVVFDAPTSRGHNFVKRVIGMPGDRVRIESGTVLVDDVPLDEPYVVFAGDYTYPAGGQSMTVPDDSYFVLGDNRPASADSHLGWVVPADNVVGQGYPLPWLPVTTSTSLDSGASDPSELTAGPIHPTDSGAPASLVSAVGNVAPDLQAEPASTSETVEAPGVVEPGQPGSTLPPSWTRARLTTEQAGRFVARGIPDLEVPADVVVSASFRKVGGAPGGGYGLILRDQSPTPLDGQNQSGNYYVLEVGDRGEIGVWRRDGERWIDLRAWTPSEMVHAGGASNDLVARAIGDRLTLVVNGVSVADVRDATLTAGRTGIFVGGDGNDVAVEGLVVRAAAASELDENSSSSGAASAQAAATNAAALLSAVDAPASPVNAAALPPSGTTASASPVNSAPAPGGIAPFAAPADSPPVPGGIAASAPPVNSAAVPDASALLAPSVDSAVLSEAALDPLSPLAAWAPTEIIAQCPGQFVAFGSPSRLHLGDVTVSATFRKIGGPPGGGYGLIVRDQGSTPLDGQNQSGRYYVLGAGDAGDIGVWRRDGERWIDLLSWTHSDAVLPGAEANELTARAVGQRLTLAVNGVEVVSLNDATLADGGIGVFVGGDGNRVAFDHFVVRS